MNNGNEKAGTDQWEVGEGVANSAPRVTATDGVDGGTGVETREHDRYQWIRMSSNIPLKSIL